MTKMPSMPNMQDWLDQRGMGALCRPGPGPGPYPVMAPDVSNQSGHTSAQPHGRNRKSPAAIVMQREADQRQRDREYQLGLLYSDRDTKDSGEHFVRRPVPSQKGRQPRGDSPLLRAAQSHLEVGLIRKINKGAKRRHVAHVLKMRAKEKANGNGNQD